MDISRTSFIILLAAFMCPAKASGNNDPFCKPINTFVESIKPGEIHEIKFLTAWGSNFKGYSEPVLSAKRCEYQGYEPASFACKVLMDSASVEFAGKNAMRVVSCLSPETQFASGIQLENVSLYFSHGTDERGSEVVVDLSEDKTLGAMVLKVVVNGY
ncbi:hypothetical protein [Shewanella mangrovisoli]|uniref:hypothetical protein n=1 Tax=Shewanella mangrovisoli TaxID=2864211 RepID=UPI001C6579CE|nr:hypothetical protein [Shewanella mangrovisoli]QYK07554.1 hypothetical protein K0H60_11950 [Shewanella mangrovisoli]